MISCLCITRGDRPGLLSEAAADFVRQTFPDRELVILHDGDDTVHAGVCAIVGAYAGASIRIERAAPGSRLGELRNIAIARARGEWICQWDDDDRCHPERLRLQWEHARSEQADVNYLVDQLHWFRPDNVLFWDDWSGEPYPMNAHPRDNPGAPRRDAALSGYRPGRGYAPELMRCFGRKPPRPFGFRASAAWDGAYIYRFHSGNAWDAAHHRAISAVKHLSPARLYRA